MFATLPCHRCMDEHEGVQPKRWELEYCVEFKELFLEVYIHSLCISHEDIIVIHTPTFAPTPAAAPSPTTILCSTVYLHLDIVSKTWEECPWERS